MQIEYPHGVDPRYRCEFIFSGIYFMYVNLYVTVCTEIRSELNFYLWSNPTHLNLNLNWCIFQGFELALKLLKAPVILTFRHDLHILRINEVFFVWKYP